MTLIDNQSILELRLNALIDKKVGHFFLPHDNTRVVSREMIQGILREIVRESLELYREDFAVEVQKMLAKARTNVIIPSG